MSSRLGARTSENGTLNVFLGANSNGCFCCKPLKNKTFSNTLLAIFQMATNNVNYTCIETAMFCMKTVKRNERLANCLKEKNVIIKLKIKTF